MKPVLIRIIRWIVKRWLRDYHVSHNPKRKKKEESNE
jgi:hypothetical protein